jgi:hypothetical protein
MLFYPKLRVFEPRTKYTKYPKIRVCPKLGGPQLSSELHDHLSLRHASPARRRVRNSTVQKELLLT